MEPNWKPREARLSPARCAGFMFMGRVSGINQYKHGISRRYLILDDEGRAYQAFGRNEFREVPIEEALALVEAPLKELGATLETPYDWAYVRRKEAALREAGIEVFRIRIVPEDLADNTL
jgi:hypothetical protein